MALEPERREGPPPIRFGLLYAILAAWLVLLVVDFARMQRNFEAIPYSQFITYLNQNKLAEVTVGSERIEGTLKDPAPGQKKDFLTNKVEDPTLTQALKDAKVKFTGIKDTSPLGGIFAWLLPLIVFFALFQYLSKRMGAGGGARGGGILSLGKSRAKIFVETDLRTRFDDVAGVDEAKAELKEIVEFLKDPTLYSRLGGRMPKGVLLVGPPGTGKTMIARAVAGEAGVPFFSINGSEFVELFVGLGAARVRDLFEQARGKAPCIIFIDELDALGKARGANILSGSGGDEKEQTLNQLLAEMDGFDPSKGVVLLAATNRPEVLDPALLRAGRFDRQVVFDKPDKGGRKLILEIHLKHIKFAKDVDTEILASMTTGFSGADLANLVNEAALIATRRKGDSVTLKDCTEAIERIVAGLERKNRVLSADEKRRVAYHEMGHAVVALARGAHESVHKVSVIPRGIAALGYTLRRPTEDRYMMSSQELKDKLAILLGGRASETIFLQDISTGAADDLDKATEVARAMAMRYGMSRKLGLATFEREQAPLLGGQPPMKLHEYSEETAQLIDKEVTRFLADSAQTAHELITEYRELVEEGVMILLTRETLNEEELKTLWNRYQLRPKSAEGLAS
ncbi:MAG TPA: cell division protein FtsH [Bdellovibrionales bacterium]|nr:MAG: cell division protein FtsH [Bdellovibrionales bacterium GWA1_52_35]OFZ43708.1 MAG: cell division protein FtsH [Bdellovibrionales bacterium GWC1_52_8]HAR43721.1 cell division protein FtsH [Bdellovibrionales bacterium]HCM40839.1 cell division protein FtsH [Bdellovibrionales bacterium]